MALDARQLKPSTKALIDKVGSDEDWEAKARTVHLALKSLYGGLQFVTDVVDGTVTAPPVLGDYVYRPGRSLSGNNFSFGTGASDVGIMYDNVFSSIGSASTGRIDAVVGTFRVRHGNTSNTGDVFQVTTTTGAQSFVATADDGQTSFTSSTTSGVVNIAWSAGGTALAVGTSGSSTLIRHQPQASVYDHKVLGTGAITWAHNTPGSALAGTWTGSFSYVANAAAVVPLTVQGAASQSAHLLDVVNSAGNSILFVTPVNSTSVGQVRIDNRGSTTNIVAVIAGVASQTGDYLRMQTSAGTVGAKFNSRGHLGINFGGAVATNNIMANLNSSTSGGGVRGVFVGITDDTWPGAAAASYNSLNTTLSNSVDGVGDAYALEISHNVQDGLSTIYAISGQCTGSGHSSSPGTAVFHSLHFATTVSGAVDVAEIVGIDCEGSNNLDTGSTAALVVGGQTRFNVGAQGGTTTTATGFSCGMQFFGGTTTTAYGFRFALGSSGGPTIGTVYGLHMADFTTLGASTTWAIYSEGGQSSHLGNFRFGSNTAPTAKVHMAAGTTAASTAPAKMTSGSLMTAAEAGAMEYDGDYFSLTNSVPTRGQICSTANVVVDSDGNVVTSGGEILLAA